MFALFIHGNGDHGCITVNMVNVLTLGGRLKQYEMVTIKVISESLFALGGTSVMLHLCQVTSEGHVVVSSPGSLLFQSFCVSNQCLIQVTSSDWIVVFAD